MKYKCMAIADVINLVQPHQIMCKLHLLPLEEGLGIIEDHLPCNMLAL